MTNPLSRSRLEQALIAEGEWTTYLEGEAAQISETIRTALDHLLTPAMTRGMMNAFLPNEEVEFPNYREQEQKIEDAYKRAITELTREEGA